MEEFWKPQKESEGDPLIFAWLHFLKGVEEQRRQGLVAFIGGHLGPLGLSGHGPSPGEGCWLLSSGLGVGDEVLYRAGKLEPAGRVAWPGLGRCMNRTMAAESGRGLARRFRQLSWEERGAQEGLRAWAPTPRDWAHRVPGKHVCLLGLSAFLSEESQLPETISIFIFLGNFTAFISGKIKTVIAGEMIPIRA